MRALVPWVAAGLLAGTVAPLAGQRPPPRHQQIEQLLGDPEAREAIRQRLIQSGLSPDQVRARLQAAGLSPTLLDQYFRPRAGGVLPGPGDSVIAAMGALGLGTADELQAYVDSVRRAALDALALDSLRVLLRDTLGLGRDTTGLRVFGLDVFRRPTTQFLPNLSGPVDDEYRLGPGDILVLILTGDVEVAHELEVTREGYVVIPRVGQVFANNLTVAQLREVLHDRVGRVYSGVGRGPNATTRVEVTVARVRMIQAYVIGEVARPGSFTIPSVSTVVTALYQAGGPTEGANFRDIRVMRGRDTVATLDLYEYLLGGVAAGDVRLESGDVVFVPAYGTRVKVTGAVLRPGIYELKPEETLTDLIDAAGGFRADAALQRLSVSRIVPPAQRPPGAPARIVVDVPLNEIRERRAPPFPIEPGDSVTVFALDESRRGSVDFRGAVYHAGTFGWYPGMRLSDLVRLGGGFRPAVVTERAHIERLNPLDSTRYLVAVALPGNAGDSFPSDVLLDEYDVVTIYGREELRNERTVYVSGMVHEPGTYPYREGMTLKDLVLMARGLRDGAYLDTAEVARLPDDRRGGRVAVRFRVPMDSTFLFEPDTTTYRFLPGQSPPARGAPDFVLRPFDNVTILRQPDFDLHRSVWITGEIRFPGPYALTRKDERLSDLVARAGGVLPTGNAEGARFVRRLGNVGRVNIDLPGSLRRPGSRQDLILQQGDSLDIPEYNPVVQVVGAVNSPGSFLWERGKGLEFYIANAGGYTRGADKSLVSVRYANGSARTRNRFLFFSSSPDPGPGSTVFVPEKPEREPFNPALFAAIAQVLAAATTIVVVATR
jgi:protein involved in polysaccharide export with SLBB domain